MFKAPRILAALTLASSLTACTDDTVDDPIDEPEPVTIVDVASDAGTFTTLIGALQETGLDATLAGEGPFTVFAPSDEAFARLPEGLLASLDSETLEKILTYHVVIGSVDSSAVSTLDSATSAEGSDLGIRIVGESVVLNGVTEVVQADIGADNGIIHVIDSVMLPPDIDFPGDLVAAVQAYPRFDSLVGAVVTADLVSALQSDNGGDGYTLFAPSNQAFIDLGIDLSTLSTEELTDVLLYHVVGQQVDAATVVGLTEAVTLLGSAIQISADENGVMLNGDAAVTRVDLRTDNGIIHIIDSVLLPPQ